MTPFNVANVINLLTTTFHIASITPTPTIPLEIEVHDEIVNILNNFQNTHSLLLEHHYELDFDDPSEPHEPQIVEYIPNVEVEEDNFEPEECIVDNCWNAWEIKLINRRTVSSDCVPAHTPRFLVGLYPLGGPIPKFIPCCTERYNRIVRGYKVKNSSALAPLAQATNSESTWTSAKSGLGARLYQYKEGDDKKFTVAYTSRSLKSAEVNYTTTELKCLALVWAVKKWHTLRLGRHFKEAVERRSIIHDINLRFWALEAKDQVDLPEFKASNWWIWKFKRVHRIVSRKITTFRTQLTLQDIDNLQDVAKSFVSNVKSNIPAIGVEEIYNADESDFNLKLHSGRTLANIGLKKVEALVQSISTTHGYSIMPIISADGRLLSPLYIVLKESTGTFGPRVLETLFRPVNIYIEASISGKLTSEHFKTWFSEVYLPNTGRKSMLLLDSWTGHCPGQLEQVFDGFLLYPVLLQQLPRCYRAPSLLNDKPSPFSNFRAGPYSSLSRKVANPPGLDFRHPHLPGS
ncbi:PREDICTED: uncharacterized protein LOC105448012 [Wasmannia auropunctata]|uniref:uncharacterized protein LOC105448012 n=1 Tax=Wasmannia auropunctata TaxID=64793 RepID=UPI0005EF1B65|nr:PREDICTED: uncharacterized protein LOC105448012 [Wasmannia auropunctata]